MSLEKSTALPIKRSRKKQDVLNRIVFQKGKTIIEQGDRGMRAYFIEQGRVEVVVEDHQHHLKVTELEAGEVFGEMTMLSGEVRTATVRAIEPTTVAVISHADLQERIDKIEDHVLKALMKVSIQRLEDTTRNQMEQFKNLTNFEDGIMGVAERLQTSVSESIRDDFQAEIMPLLGQMQDVFDKYKV